MGFLLLRFTAARRWFGASRRRTRSERVHSCPKSVGYPMNKPARCEITKRGERLRKWAWVELNYRPHAYQAATEGPGIRHHNAISLTDRAICPDCRREVPWLSGINRHHNRHHETKSGRSWRRATRSRGVVLHARLTAPDRLSRQEARQAVALLPVSKDAFFGAGRLINLASIYATVGEPDAALEQLEAARKVPSGISLARLRLDPTFMPLRGNPRFERLVAGR